MINTFTRTNCNCGFTSLDLQGLERTFPACPMCGEQVSYIHNIHLLNCQCGDCGTAFQINAASAVEQPSVCPVPGCESSNVALLPPARQVDLSAVTKEEYLAALAAHRAKLQP